MAAWGSESSFPRRAKQYVSHCVFLFYIFILYNIHIKQYVSHCVVLFDIFYIILVRHQGLCFVYQQEKCSCICRDFRNIFFPKRFCAFFCPCSQVFLFCTCSQVFILYLLSSFYFEPALKFLFCTK